jgi:hypothetical protein
VIDDFCDVVFFWFPWVLEGICTIMALKRSKTIDDVSQWNPEFSVPFNGKSQNRGTQFTAELTKNVPQVIASH